MVGYGKCKFVVPGPQKKNLRLAIKGMALASPEKVWRKRQYSILCTFCINVLIAVDNLFKKK